VCMCARAFGVRHGSMCHIFSILGPVFLYFELLMYPHVATKSCSFCF